VIPAFDEEAAVGLVLDEIPRAWADRVIVVDNASRDRTAEVAAAHGAEVLRETRRGYGAACLRGIAATGAETEVIVILDADHSDYPQDLPELLGPIASGEADFVIGSRTIGRAEAGALPWNQRWGNALACRLMHALYGHRFTDMGPFRAIRRWRRVCAWSRCRCATAGAWGSPRYRERSGGRSGRGRRSSPPSCAIGPRI
jgi:glycosyltransferase involved in cell wall biosynthesis